LIVAGGCRGRRLAGDLAGEGYAVRVTTRTESGRMAIEAAGAECWIGTPERLSTLRAALESVTIVCWLLGTAVGSDAEVRALHGSRLERFLGQTIDTTVRGFVYEAAGAADGAVPAEALAEGEQIVLGVAERNEIPVGFLRADPGDADAWLAGAHAEIEALLLGRVDQADG
jgi:hypothetical protein